MNLYIRYFNYEALVHSVDEALDFLYTIPEITLDDRLANDVRAYAESDVMYPKRYKVRPRVYFIIIKTLAQTMQDFKSKKNLQSSTSMQPQMSRREQVANTMLHLEQERQGWYEAELDFKRVVTNPTNGKNEYRDTHFAAQLKANSAKDCYDRLVDHLRARVDGRSQFPSVKGKNFRYKYLGMWK